MGGPISIYDVVRVLGLEPRPGALVAPDSRQASFVCPMCERLQQRKGYSLSVNFQKDTFICPKCWNKGGATSLYSLVRFGEKYQKGTSRAKEIISAMRAEINGKLSYTAVTGNYIPHTPQADIAPDEKLDRVYRTLFSLPRLALSDKHRENLRKRGLSDAAIDFAGFRTMPATFSGKLSAGIKELIKTLPVPLSEQQVAVGGIIVWDLQDRGINDFTGVPGFFKLGGFWIMYTTPGIMIPTKNEKGQIVSVQVRRDSGDIRYMTLSNKSLPCHVQSGISRAHVVGNFDFHNVANLRAPFAVLLTEGPLKADVIAHLWNRYREDSMRILPDNIIIVAIQGVKNTACLDPILAWLRSINVHTIYNALDMDRITNKNVRSGSIEVQRLLKEKGFAFPALCWGYETTKMKRILLKQHALRACIPLPERTGNPYKSMAMLCEALENVGINHSMKGDYWPSCSKGLDDWLHQQQLNRHSAN